MTDAEVLWRALCRLPPRSAQLLVFRFVEERSPEESARLYGISPDALQTHLDRAGALFVRALQDPDGPPLLPDDEPSGADDREALRRLRENATLVRQVAEAQARAEEDSPARRREDWLRRVALAVLVAVALWLYLRQ